MDESRSPQDGKISMQMSDHFLDLRLNMLPSATAHVSRGEDLVIRLLDRETAARTLGELGFSSALQQQLVVLYRQPYGMIISTGPTGSGKSTTQHAVLTELNTEDKNILTVEDPVEYATDGITQVQINVKAGMGYAEAIRAFLRHDPDIIMVGEMRDKETADVAIECALTGHLVLSTLHTNNAPSAITRLIDMGIAPYHIPDTVSGVIAQRLARKICPKCKTSHQIEGSKLQLLGYDGDPTKMVTVYKGNGCDACSHVGTRGRIGIFELMVMTEEICELVTKRASTVEIRRAAIAKGMKTLKVDALEKVLAGEIPYEEALAVSYTAGGNGM
jgi:type II secretory ATPase GspE/PulE/Tfp pilus assembly ATPase PilB-like protein